MRSLNFENLIERLDSQNPDVRIEGWDGLRSRCADPSATPLAPFELLNLQQRLDKEAYPEVAAAGVRAMQAHLLRDWVNVTPGTIEDSAPADDPAKSHATNCAPRACQHQTAGLAPLFGAIWDPFLDPSFVFGLKDPDNLRRDEAATFALRGWIGNRDFRHTSFAMVPMNDPQFDAILKGSKPSAICLVGRPTLFGSTALQRWSCPNLTFGFPAIARSDAAPHHLDHAWHRIVMQSPAELRVGKNGRMDGEILRGPFVTTDFVEGGVKKRVDYALVQRFCVQDPVLNKKITVVVIAGASALGTLGAAMWANLGFEPPYGCVETGIPLPRGATRRSCLEVLLEVTAPCTPPHWEPNPATVLAIKMDRSVWNFDDEMWHVVPPKKMTMVCSRHDNRVPPNLLFDGMSWGIDPNGEIGRILVRLCEASLKKPGASVDIKKLARDPWVVGTRPSGCNLKGEVERIRKQIYVLARQYFNLKEGLFIDEDKVWLSSDIVVERIDAPNY